MPCPSSRVVTGPVLADLGPVEHLGHPLHGPLRGLGFGMPDRLQYLQNVVILDSVYRLATHDWADAKLLRNSIELFARFVMPHFRGHNATYQDEWRRIREQRDAGGVTLNVTGPPNNLKSF